MHKSKVILSYSDKKTKKQKRSDSFPFLVPTNSVYFSSAINLNLLMALHDGFFIYLYYYIN